MSNAKKEAVEQLESVSEQMSDFNVDEVYCPEEYLKENNSEVIDIVARWHRAFSELTDCQCLLEGFIDSEKSKL